MISTFYIIAFWLAVGLMFHSYVLYPLLLKLFSIGKKQNDVLYGAEEELPRVFVVFSVYNEEKVLLDKLMSIVTTSYPLNKLRVYIGSDMSTDDSDKIIEEFAVRFPNLSLVFTPFKERGGKSNVLNKLLRKVEASGLNKQKDILVFTDANVMFTPDTLYQLAKHFKNEAIGQVSANIQNRGIQQDGISFQEKTYINRENTIKYLEGLNWGSMMGAFGACYAMRAGYWTAIPPNYLMEDFYLSMHILRQGGKSISEPQAICYEDVSNEVEQEYKRKVRIQAGNFQNLSVYWPLLFRFNAVSFAFLSHKVLRWLGPVFILLAFVANLALLPLPFYQFTMVLQLLLLFSPFLDTLLKRIGIHLVLLRFVSYFYLMNLALVMGFVMYAKGVKTNTWSPTKRNI